jgi:hypothetical protein
MKPGATTSHASVEPWPWWAHLVGARSTHNIGLTILCKKIEDLMNVRGVGEKSFLKLKPLVTVTATKGESAGQ